ncbi:hypothetical protein LCY76_03455 [Fictibacillus sp. KIGAM418]|uniref:Uncharacterized protein n=1 Tax=Fictibacillus marinisediminis TaxID=2878389 RepID=A0A9X1X881_9BACL|nr:hypothetical protein [Fictibacillus marinisediminis]MCK6255678.1 hypothetical protein [Fictibacillus marinisediminis]
MKNKYTNLDGIQNTHTFKELLQWRRESAATKIFSSADSARPEKGSAD